MRSVMYSGVTLESKSLLTFEEMLAQSSILRDNVFTVMLWAIAITEDGGPSMFFFSHRSRARGPHLF